MNNLTITTNHVPRDLIYGFQLSQKEREDFDYLTGEDLESHSFFRYQGIVYDPSEFMPIDLDDWDGYSSDSFFSGTLIRYTEDCDQVIVGRYSS